MVFIGLVILWHFAVVGLDLEQQLLMCLLIGDLLCRHSSCSSP